MSQNEENELECLIIEYKDKLEVATINKERTSGLNVVLDYLKQLKDKGQRAPALFIEAINDADRASRTFSLISRSIG